MIFSFVSTIVREKHCFNTIYCNGLDYKIKCKSEKKDATYYYKY